MSTNNKLSISDLFKDQWTQAVALSVAVFAVCAAISSLKASSFSTKVSLFTTVESKNWSYFQSKSIKQHVSESELRHYTLYLAENHSEKATAFAKEQVHFLEKEIARYDSEKNAIKKEAETSGKNQEQYKKQSASFSLATMLLQICIMLSSISTLTKKRLLWATGLVFGIAGLLYMINGFFLLF